MEEEDPAEDPNGMVLQRGLSLLDWTTSVLFECRVQKVRRYVFDQN